MKAKLLILGVLHRGDFHPYEIRRRLVNAMVECYMDVDVGTLYYAVRQLEKDGLIDAVAEERVARGGLRVIYGLTAKGRREFKTLLHQEFEVDQRARAQDLYGAMLFLHLCDPAAIEDLLRARIARLGELIGEVGGLRKDLASVLSTGGAHLLRHLDLQRRLDRRWLRGVLLDVEARRISDVPDPKALGSRKSDD